MLACACVCVNDAAPVWHCLLHNVTAFQVAAFAFPALVNSMVQVTIFGHFALCASGLATPGYRTFFHSALTFLQLGRGVVLVAHAFYALGVVGVPSQLAYLQIVYCMASIAMFTLFNSPAKKEAATKKAAAAKTVKGGTTADGKPKRARKYRPDKLHMRIYGNDYDCTSFQDRHPGNTYRASA